MKNSINTKKKHRPMSYEKKRALWGIIFLVPWALGLIFFFLVPIVKTFYYSLNEITLGSKGYEFFFVGFDNYKSAMTNETYFTAPLLAAVKDTLLNTPFQIFVSLFVAMLLNGEYKGRGFFRLLFFIPIILATGITDIDITGVTAGMGSSDSTSFISAEWLEKILYASPIPVEITEYTLAYAKNIMSIISKAGVQTLIFLAGLQNISPSLYEGAKIEGCTKFESFCKITLPMISPMILVCMVYSLADNLAESQVVKYMREATFKGNGAGVATAECAIYFGVSMAIVLILMAIVSKGVFYYDKD